MNFSDETTEIIKPFLSNFNKYKSEQLSRNNEKQLNTILLTLYNDIYNSYKKVELLKGTNCFKGHYHKIEKKSDKIIPLSYDSTIFPQHIRSYIEENERSYLNYKCKIGGRDIKIIFTIFADEVENNNTDIYINYVKMIYVWLTICSTYALKTCAESLTIYVYNTPFNKTLPENMTTTLSNIHVNTAYTSSCVSEGEIVIFRNEEWFKVFIHETFHSFGLDFSRDGGKLIRDNIAKLFPIKSEFNIYEAYSETWARIINCCFNSYNSLENKKDKKTFIINSTFCLELERMFTLYQCNKILRFMGLNYIDICNSRDNNIYLRRNMYRENTNVFSYYIMSSIFMNNYFEFLNWCNNNSTNVGNCIQFNNTTETYKKFIDYISRDYKCDMLLKGLKDMDELHKKILKQNNKILLSTIRMTLLG
jgi:hypothetical protein